MRLPRLVKFQNFCHILMEYIFYYEVFYIFIYNFHIHQILRLLYFCVMTSCKRDDVKFYVITKRNFVGATAFLMPTSGCNYSCLWDVHVAFSKVAGALIS